MSPINIRYEANNAFTQPFQMGLRHFELAISDGSQDSLKDLAKERVIYRTFEAHEEYKPLNTSGRVCHIVLGVLETVGYVTLVVPFIVAVAEMIFNKPYCSPKGLTAEDRIHLEEGGGIKEYESKRANPFTPKGLQDPFYKGASWVPLAERAFAWHLR